jgi:hypothetical protein
MIAAPGQLDSRHVAHQVNGETTFRKPNRSRKARRETPLKSHLVDSQLVERIGRGIMSFTGNERRNISGGVSLPLCHPRWSSKSTLNKMVPAIFYKDIVNGNKFALLFQLLKYRVLNYAVFACAWPFGGRLRRGNASKSSVSIWANILSTSEATLRRSPDSTSKFSRTLSTALS